jgi:hypothetical protein
MESKPLSPFVRRRRALRGRGVLAACLVLGAALATAAARAGEPPALPHGSIYLLPHDGLHLPAASLTTGEYLAAATKPAAEDAPTRYAPAYGSTFARAALIEMPAEVVPGRYTRPKYALGFRSDTMKGLAKDVGLDAHTCLLPLVRARLSLSQEQGTSGRVMIFARCSFH